MKLLGLIGYPLTHSFSRQYFFDKFKRERIEDWQYELFPIRDTGEIPDLIADNPELQGFNVTIPYKQAILPLLQNLTEEASTIGAVNTVKIDRGEDRLVLTGFNTDVYGFEQSLTPLLRPHHARALILGTGGSSRAVQYVLKQMGIAFTLVSRSQGKNELTYASLTPEIISKHTLIINTTPCGMFPDVMDYPPIPYGAIGPEHLLYDLIYNPEETVFLKKGLTRGATVKNGLEMLRLQAEKAWEVWTEEEL